MFRQAPTPFENSKLTGNSGLGDRSDFPLDLGRPRRIVLSNEPKALCLLGDAID